MIPANTAARAWPGRSLGDLEEVNACGGNSGTVHGRCTTCSPCCVTAARRRSATTCPNLPAGPAPAIDGRHGADHRYRHHQDQDHRRAARATSTSSMARSVDLAGAAFRPDDSVGTHHAVGRSHAQIRRHVDLLIDLREAIGKGLTVQPIANMVNHETNELFFDNLELPADSLIGEEGKGFRYILDGLNAERTLIAAECIGDGRWFIEKGQRLRPRPGRIRPADRPEPGRAVPHCRGAHRNRSGRPDALARL